MSESDPAERTARTDDFERTSLRFQAIDLAAAGDHRRAGQTARRAAELYWAAWQASADDPVRQTAEAVSLIAVTHERMVSAFAISDYATVLDALTDGVRLRRALAATPPAVATARAAAASVADTLALTTTIASALAAPQPAVAAALASCADAEATLRELAASDSTRSEQPAGPAPQPAAALSHEPGAAVDRAAAAAIAALDRLAAQLTGPGEGDAELLAARDDLLAHFTGPGLPYPDAVATAESRLLTLVEASATPDTARALLHRAEVVLTALSSAAGVRIVRDGLRLADTATQAALVRADTGPAAARLAEAVEVWRARLDTDWDKIQATDLALPFFDQLVDLLVDLGLPQDALVAAERARARAFADLVHGTPASPTAPLPTSTGIHAALNAPVVIYHLGARRLTVWTAAGGRLSVTWRAVDRTELAVRIDEIHDLLEHGHQNDAVWQRLAASLRWLGDLLWEPVETTLLPDNATVAVVAHQEMLRVPFAALRPAGQAPLVRRYAFTHLPALSLLRAPEGRQVRPAAPLLHALVDPEPTAWEVPSLSWTRERFATAVASWYTPGRAIVRYGPAATTDAVPAAADVLYLGAHADVAAAGDDPMDSYIVLARGADDDGVLRARDVADLRLTADLVILAGCRTGGGHLHADGVVGLSRSFLAAGPTKLVMTLSKVGERAVLELMFRFHRYWLGEAHTLAAALRLAQLSVLDQHPYDYTRWCPFVLFGVHLER